MYVEGDVPVMSYGNCNNGYGNNSWGGWEGIIGLALVAALFGNGGFGFGGGFGGRGGFGTGDFMGWQMGRLATTNDVASGFSTSEIMSDLNSIILGQAQMQNFINQGFAGLQTSLCQGFNGLQQSVLTGFHGVDNAICTLGYQNAQNFNALGHQLSDCCCKLERGIDSVNYNMATNTCAIQTSLANATRDIIDSQRCGTDKILNFLTSEKIAALQAENSGLKAQISNDRQTTNIVNELRNGNCPVPAYLACDPRVPFNYGQYFNNGGCGCGCN